MFIILIKNKNNAYEQYGHRIFKTMEKATDEAVIIQNKRITNEQTKANFIIVKVEKKINVSSPKVEILNGGEL